MDVAIERVNCAECHIPFWLQAAHVVRLRATKESFKCPSGHSLSYHGPNEADELRKRLTAVEQQKTALADRIDANAKWARHEEYRVRALKGIVTKLKKARR